MILGTFVGAWIGEFAKARSAQGSKAASGHHARPRGQLALSSVIAWYVVREVFA